MERELLDMMNQLSISEYNPRMKYCDKFGFVYEDREQWILILENINVRKNIREFFEKMQEFFPSTKNAYIESVEEYGEVLETVVIEDIFMPELLTLLAKNEDAELLSNMFNYFEEIINKNDSHLINIFSVTVLEILGNDKAILKVAKQYMGGKTALLQMKVDKELGRL